MPIKAGIGQFCELFGKSRQAFYELQKHREIRKFEAALIIQLVEDERGDGRFGVRSLMRILAPVFAEHHIQIGRDRLFNLLAEHNMLIRPLRRYVRTTDSNHIYHKWSNLIKDMEINRPGQVWVSDITYIRTKNGFLYLSLITDAYSKKIVGYHLSHRLEARGPIAALNMAISQREHPDQPLIHHSDRGIQYCCTKYVERLQKEGIAISMAEKGNPYENAVAERLNRTLKEQLGMNETFDNYQLAMAKLVKVIEVYNYKRPHSSCDFMTPAEAHKCTGPLKKHWKKRKSKATEGGGAAALHTSRQV